MAFPVVILGAAGMLGGAWARQTPAWKGRAERVRLLTRRECDLLDAASVRRAVAPGVEVVINCAGYTDVDRAESEEAAATNLNGDAVGALAERCREVGALLVHFSTDYVFAGDATRPYVVDHPRSPINAYGRGKARGEQLIEQAVGADGALVVRTSWLYAPHGRNFVRTIASLAAERPALRVVSDQRGRPTSCDALVAATRGLIDAGARGVFHVCNSGECTWFDLASAVAQRVNPACIVQPCTSAEFPRPARRPMYSVLDLGRAEGVVGGLPDWRTSLDRVLDALAIDAPAGR